MNGTHERVYETAPHRKAQISVCMKLHSAGWLTLGY